MARILFISYYYPPEKAAAAVCVSETAKRLVKRGHCITVLTTVPNYPTGSVPAQYRGHLLQQEVIDGVRVVRVWSYVSANTGFLRRILAHLSFACLATLLGWQAVGHPDVIIVGSPPLFTVIAARILSWLKQAPLVFWVADLWPESAIQLGILHHRLFIRLSEWLEWSTYQQAQLVWAVTQGMYETLIHRGLSPQQIFLLPNGVDTEKFRPVPKAIARCELRWDDRCIVLYAGTHGLSHGLATVLDAAEQLQQQNRHDIRFVLVGDGAEKAALIALAQRRDLNNVLFLDPVPHDRVPLLLAAADICLAHTRKVQIFEGMLPMKMYEAMAAGRPLVLALNGEACQMAVYEAKAALHVEPENAVTLVSAILYLCDHPQVAAQLGQSGRAYVQERFDYETLTATLDARLTRMVKEMKLT
jgi:glycosyltransferase involved in cell wall biosynthesis